MENSKNASRKQGAVIGGWICLLLGALAMLWSLFSFFIYLPLFLAAFVLGIVAIAQRRLANGIPILLLSVLIPIVLAVSLGAFRTVAALNEVNRAANERRPLPESAVSSETGESLPSLGLEPTGPTEEEIYVRDHLELYDFQAKYYETRLEGRVPGVDFKLRNNGERTLETVEVVVYFEDGYVIAEEDFIPVLVTEYSFGSDNKPFKPGYIWQQERGKFYTAKSVPSEWKEGAATAEVTSVRFEQN
jgi:hypothetical protein